MGASNTPVVWVVQSQGTKLDYSKAKMYGDLDVLFNGYIEQKGPNFESIFRVAVGKIGPDDYILLSGSKLLNGLVMHYVWEKYGICRVLQFDTWKQQYQDFNLVGSFGLQGV